MAQQHAFFSRATLGLSAVICVLGMALSTGANAQETTYPQPSFTNFLGMQFVDIPTGIFVMGSCPTLEEAQDIDSKFPITAISGCDPDTIPDPHAKVSERPQRRVPINKPFQMAVYETTIAQYKAFLKTFPNLYNEEFSLQNSQFKQENNHPVVSVSFDDAQNFVTWVNKRKPEDDLGTYRLPSEAEWEYAARAGARTPYWWGMTVHCKNADYDFSRCSPLGPSEVGQYPANPFGLYDMNGNVAEWVADCWAPSYIGQAPAQEARHEEECTLRIFRGGSWQSNETMIRSAHREVNSGLYRYNYTGIRLVRDLP